MTGAPVSPPAIRLRRPGWRDPRLLGGLVLVAVSVAIGSTAVASAGRTVAVLATPDALVPGDVLDVDRLVVRDVRLAEADGRYLTAADAPAADLVVVRTIGPGELVPVAAVAPEAELGLRAVAVTPTAGISAGVVPGAAVDLWFVPAPAAQGEPAAEPRELAAGLTVAEVGDGAGALTVGGTRTVHVLVPLDLLPDVLGALAADGSVEVVPVAGVVPQP